MMDWTDRHCRFFLRQLSRHTLLYSEMVTTGALLHGDAARFLRHDESEHPLALQLGGSVPAELAACAKLAETAGYDEVNLNVGCPSDRVQNNMIGACLMGHPQLVADCVKAMRDAVGIEVTVKHRIGINGRDSYAELCDFVGQVRDAGCRSFTVHARIAILEGLSPKQNREVPPLRYDVAAQLKRDFPDLEIVLNGGIKTLDECREHLRTFDGVMLGREAYHNPYLLARSIRNCSAARPHRSAAPRRCAICARTSNGIWPRAAPCTMSPATCSGWARASPAPGASASCSRRTSTRRTIHWPCWNRPSCCWKGTERAERSPANSIKGQAHPRPCAR
ncbi:tRNA-dihydrouridine synthase A [Pseudomonas sp. BAY1663]|nr:tRNA-dihydrouridine synthase A [Pseudomonas sp. BAY1663]